MVNILPKNITTKISLRVLPRVMANIREVLMPAANTLHRDIPKIVANTPLPETIGITVHHHMEKQKFVAVIDAVATAIL